MIDLIKPILENFRHRLTNPLLGAYASFWAIYNSSFLYYFFMADQNVEDKISRLSKIYHQNFFWNDGAAFLNSTIPFLLATGYITIFPWIQLLVQKVQNSPHKKRMTEIAELEEHQLNSREDCERAKARLKHIPELMLLEIEKTLEQEKVEIAELKNKSENLKQTKLINEAVKAGEQNRKKLMLQTASQVAKKQNQPKEKTNLLNVRDVELFENVYGLENMEIDRTNNLIDYIINHLKIKDFDLKSAGKIQPVADFINYVMICDKVTQGKNNLAQIPFGAIKRIQLFHKVNKFPKGDDEWAWFIKKIAPNYGVANMDAAADEWAREHRENNITTQAPHGTPR